MFNFVAMLPLRAISILVINELIVRRGGLEALLVVVTTRFVTSSPPKLEEWLNAYVFL